MWEMTENEKVEPPTSEDIDNLLSESDPDFLDSLAEIEPQEGEDFSSLEIGSSLVGPDALSGEVDPTQLSPWAEKWPRLYQWGLKFDRGLSLLWERWLRLQKSLRYLRLTFKTGPREFLAYLKVMASVLRVRTKAQISRLGALTMRQKSGLVGGVILSFSILFLARLNLQGIWLPGLSSHGPVNLSAEGQPLVFIDPHRDSVPLFLFFPEARYTVLFSKVIVNLKRRSGHSENPMGAFEFFVSLDTKEGVAELQQREGELLDRVQRGLEDLTYPELQGAEGPQRLREVVRRELNQALALGQVREVHVNTMVMKP